MKTLLITGPIACGKSEVCRYLISKGYPVYDCDSRTKALYESVPGLKQRIEKALGVSWSELSIIFTDAQKRQKLESMVYPLVAEDIRQWKNGLNADLAFIESALALGRSEFDGLYDEVLMVSAGTVLREQRNSMVAQRDHLQTFDLSKVKYSITNEDTIEELHSKIDKLLCRLI